ncbi:MAG TPA: arylesterase [Steroidobacteraceae bacterium]|nr:arylesterase [Steroidobacteraceae bacterium]
MNSWLMRGVFVLLAYVSTLLGSTLLGAVLATVQSSTFGLDLGLRSSVAAAAAPAAVPTILVVGDSLSAGYGIDVNQGWVALMERRLKSQGYGYRVVNASVSGETSAGARSRLPRLFELHKPAIMILEIGANDGLRGLPLAQTRENLKVMLDLAAKSQTKALLVGMQIPPNYGAQYADGFAALFSEQAKTRQLPYVPFFLDGVALDMSLMQPDGLHPKAIAQPRLLDNVWTALAPVLKK